MHCFPSGMPRAPLCGALGQGHVASVNALLAAYGILDARANGERPGLPERMRPV